MEPVLFYGVPQGCSFGSIVALEWLGQPYRLCRIEMLEQPWEALYGRINPLFQTPALLLENGEALTESLAILQHLAARDLDAGLGFRQGSRDHDRLNEMLAWLTSDFFTAFAPLWTVYEREGLDAGQQRLLRTLGTENVGKASAHLDRLLAERDWLLGNRRSVADAYLAGVARWIRYLQVYDQDTETPHLARHLAKLEQDPAVQFAYAIERGESPAGTGHFKGHVQWEELRPLLAA